jgi:hypothetical protein
MDGEAKNGDLNEIQTKLEMQANWKKQIRMLQYLTHPIAYYDNAKVQIVPTIGEISNKAEAN